MAAGHVRRAWNKVAQAGFFGRQRHRGDAARAGSHLHLQVPLTSHLTSTSLLSCRPCQEVLNQVHVKARPRPRNPLPFCQLTPPASARSLTSNIKFQEGTSPRHDSACWGAQAAPSSHLMWLLARLVTSQCPHRASACRRWAEQRGPHECRRRPRRSAAPRGLTAW